MILRVSPLVYFRLTQLERSQQGFFSEVNHTTHPENSECKHKYPASALEAAENLEE